LGHRDLLLAIICGLLDSEYSLPLADLLIMRRVNLPPLGDPLLLFT
jgi:hypothetical protein